MRGGLGNRQEMTSGAEVREKRGLHHDQRQGRTRKIYRRTELDKGKESRDVRGYKEDLEQKGNQKREK